MKNSLDVLSKLKSQRAHNISKTMAWVEDDFKEMMTTYQTAKEIAIDANDVEAVAILDEKLSQLNEAMRVKNNNSRDVQV